MEYLDVALRAVVGFSVLLLLTRLLGKKQLGQLNIFTYITGIVIGNIAGDMLVHKDIKIVDGILGMALWAFFAFIVEYLALKWPKARVVLDGEPSIVIKKGQIMPGTLRKLRLNIDDLTMLLRTNSVFSITDVEYAILEPNGDLSILKKPEKEILTRKDINLSPPQITNLPGEIIVDGKIVYRNLDEFGKTKNWLDNELMRLKIDSPKDVLYAELQNDGSLYIQRK